jgi:hypothetical protein
MKPVRIGAGVAGLVEGSLLAWVGLDSYYQTVNCPSTAFTKLPSCFTSELGPSQSLTPLESEVFIVLGIVIALASIVGLFLITGLYLDAILSLLGLAVLIFFGFPLVPIGALICGVAGATVLLDLLAARWRERAPAGTHPMDMPVFG